MSFRVKYLLPAFLMLLAQTLSTTEEQCVISLYEEVSEAVRTCQNIVIDNVAVPGGQTLGLSLLDGTTLTFRGRTYFEFAEWAGPLINLSGNNITLIAEEDAVLDGQGALWWDGKGTWGAIKKPKFIKIAVTNGHLIGVNILNCPVACVVIGKSQNLTISKWNIDILSGDKGVAPEGKYAHNTDGFGVGFSQNVLIEDTTVFNQDDCVAISNGKNITIRNFFCHGSHGLSISAGAHPLEDVLIENSIVTMAENGIHVKTHVGVGNGSVKNIHYRNITLLDSTQYGINIQQNYRNLPEGQPQDGPPDNNIPIQNLIMENIYGNVLNGAIPVYVLCANEGCFDWKWKNVQLLGAVPDNCTNYTPEGYNC